MMLRQRFSSIPLGIGAVIWLASTGALPAGTWLTLPDMPSAHGEARAQRLKDGRVLVYTYTYNGDETAYPVTGSVYDPVANTWTSTGPMVYGQGHGPSALLPDGRVLIVANDSTVANRTAEIYDPATNGWSAVPQMLDEHLWGEAVALPGGRVLVVGGARESGDGQPLPEIYDPVSNTWSATAPMHSPIRWLQRRCTTRSRTPGPTRSRRPAQNRSDWTSRRRFSRTAGCWSRAASTSSQTVITPNP